MSEPIPKDILIDIAHKAAMSSFRKLGAFLAMGNDGKEAAYSTIVLHDAKLEEFLDDSSMAIHNQKYREIFERCYMARNPTTVYLEGLRIAVQNGPRQHGVCLLNSVAEDNPHALFASALFMICEGEFEDGMSQMEIFYSKMHHLTNAVNVADTVMNQIVGFSPTFPGKYSGIFRYKDLPECIFGICRMSDCCFDCLAYWYTFAVVAVC